MRSRWLVGTLAFCALAGCRQDSPALPKASSPPAAVVDSNPPIDSVNRTYHLRDLATTKVGIGGREIEAWVMDDEGKRQEGMKWLTEAEVGPDRGMLFVFDAPQKVAFWMEDTLIPLDIVFISESRKVLNVIRGEPQDMTKLPSAGPILYALELRAGTAKRLGVHPGQTIQIPSDLFGR